MMIDFSLYLLALPFVFLALPLFLPKRDKQLRNLPKVHLTRTLDMKDKMQEAYRKYSKNGGVYMADYPSPSSHAFIMLPVNLMNELKLRPVSEVSALEEISDRFLGRYSGIGQHQPTVLNAMRTDLARIANKSIRTLLEDCSAVVATELSDSANGITLTAYSLSNRLISKMIGTMVAGREFGHDEAWLRLAPSHNTTAAAVAFSLENWPHLLRPLIAPLLGAAKQLHKNHQEMQSFLKPFVQDRVQSSRRTEPVDMLQAVIKAAPDAQKTDIKMLSACILDISMFALLTTTNIMTQVLLNLALSPSAQKMLLNEINQVLAGRPFTSLTQADLIELQKLDSFIKETQRLSPPGPIAVTRKITARQGITLSNGLYLPYGSYVALSAYSMMRDLDIFPGPEQFDGTRFYKLRQAEGHSTKHQFVSLSDYDINFGAGPSACPGRFLVSYELKIVVAYVLLNYELAVGDGAEEAPETNRFGAQPEAKVTFRPHP